MNLTDSLPSPIFAYGLPLPAGSTGLILFVMYVIFGPGTVLFQIIAMIRYHLLDKKDGSPRDATIQWRPLEPQSCGILHHRGPPRTPHPCRRALPRG